MLFSVRSRYYCTIGLGDYLGLEVNASHIHARYLTHATLVTHQNLSHLPIRGFHPLWRHVPEDF